MMILYGFFTKKYLILISLISFSTNLSDVSMLLFQVDDCNSGFLKTSLIYTFKIKFFMVKY